ncbi:MAG: BatA and WFA domain-containing protein [Planctomycetota bacterium]|nr:BatA and WFA domain-containing protein [Planctomycetota bacterium]MDP7249583.1 BatA and WFA domain-containing protein [Planctomycetota bacterium]
MNELYFLSKPALAALALLVVVAILYILRMPRQKVQLSSLAYLAHLQKDAKRQRRRMRTIISMLVQAVALSLLAFSAARPLISSGRLTEQRIVLVMDVSASMHTKDGKDGGTRFDEAKAKAREIIRRMEHGDRMLIIAADSEARIVQQFEKDRRTLYRTLDGLRAGFQTTDLSQAFDLVREVIRPLSEPQIYLLSDGAEVVRTLRGRSDEFTKNYSDILSKIQFHAFGEKQGNVGIVSFSSRRNMDSERDFSALLVLQNTFNEPQKVAIRLSIGGQKEGEKSKPDSGAGGTTIDVREVTLPPNELHTEMYEKTLLVGGQFTAEVTLLDTGVEDAFAVDNTAYEWIPKRERIKVLVVAPQEELGGYLDAAMSANIGVQGYRISPDKYNKNYDVGAMIFYNWIPSRLPDSHLIFVNTSGKNPAASITKDAVLRPLMRTWDRTHPLMNYISLENLLIAESLGIKQTDFMEPIARTVQTPIILAGRRGPQKLVFVAFDPKQSDFPFRLAFPVLVSNSLLWFTQNEVGEQKTQIKPGEVVEIRVPASKRNRPTEIFVTDPLKEESVIPVIGDTATYTQTHLCGTYTYDIGRQKHGFAVNLSDPTESRIAPNPEFQESFKEAQSIEEKAPVVERELWFVLNWFALVLLCIEAYVYHQRILF